MDISVSLAQARVICFIPSTDLTSARSFYSDKLKLPLTREDEYALEYQMGETKLRVTLVTELNPASYTILGWEVDDITKTIKSLHKLDIEFIFYDGMPQDKLGICTFPGNSRVAWFHDPDNNILSITQLS